MGATSSCPPWSVSAMPLYLSSGRPAFPRDNTLFNWHYLLGKAATASDALFEGYNTTAVVFDAAQRSQWVGKAEGALLSARSNAPRAAAALKEPGALNLSATKELKASARMGTPDIWHHGSNKRNSKMLKIVPKERIQLTRKWSYATVLHTTLTDNKNKNFLKWYCQTKVFNVHNTRPCRCSEYKKFKNIRNPW